MISELMVKDLMIPENSKWKHRFFICLQSMLNRAKCFSVFICEQSFQSAEPSHHLKVSVLGD